MLSAGKSRLFTFSTLADNAMKDACGATNPKQPSKDEVVALYQAAYQG